ncbi:unnamed protein product [Prorocentrum cordatum]|uniref:Uncharacterized protein n=1 Tax=Prorocentrum cordatum TaxID=2364126 RepID=A0ABN9W8M6_9DINO|nr:unnamed protein product [Polarella glacialis]
MRSALAAHPPGEASARRGGARGAMAARLLGRGAVAAAVASAVQLEVERAGSPGTATGRGRVGAAAGQEVLGEAPSAGPGRARTSRAPLCGPAGRTAAAATSRVTWCPGRGWSGPTSRG